MHTEQVLATTGTLKELQSTRSRLAGEADRMEGTRYGLVMENYPKMLQGREMAKEAVHCLSELRSCLVNMKAEITLQMQDHQ